METVTNPSPTTISNQQEVQTVGTTRTDATQVMKARIPQAINDLGGVAKSNDIKAWILNKESASKADFGLCKSAGVLKKYPNGRYHFDIAYVSQTVSLKKKGVLFTPAWSWLSTTPDAELPNGVEAKLPKNRAEMAKQATEPADVDTIDTLSAQDTILPQTEVEVEPESFGNAEAEDMMGEYEAQTHEQAMKSHLEFEENLQQQRNTAYLEEHGEDSLTPTGGEIEVNVNEEGQRVALDARGREWVDTESTPSEDIQPPSEIESEIVFDSPEEIVFDSPEEVVVVPEEEATSEDSVWDDIFEEEEVAPLELMHVLPESKFLGKMESRDGIKSILLSEDEGSSRHYIISLDLDPTSIGSPRAQKMYRKLQIGELKVADKILKFFSNQNPNQNLETHVIEMGVPFHSITTAP